MLNLITRLIVGAILFGEDEGKFESTEQVSTVCEKMKFKGDTKVRFIGFESRKCDLTDFRKPYKVIRVTKKCYKIKIIRDGAILVSNVNAE